MLQPNSNITLLEASWLLFVLLGGNIYSQSHQPDSLMSADSSPALLDTFSMKSFFSKQANGQLQFSAHYSDQPLVTEVLSTSTGWNYRIQGANTFSVSDLPIAVEYTYANNPISRHLENGFSFQFDYKQYKSILLTKVKKRAKQQLEDLQSRDTITQGMQSRIESYRNLFESNKLDPQLLDEHYLDSLKAEVRSEKYTGIQDKIDHYEDSIDNIRHQGAERLDRYKQRRQALEKRVQQLQAMRSHITRAEHLQKLQRKYEGLKSRYAGIDSTARQKISEYHKLLKQQPGDMAEGKLRQYLKDFGLYRQADKYLQYLKSFQVGRLKTNWSKYSMSSLPVKGVKAGFRGKSGSISIVYGNGHDVNLFTIYRALSDSTNLFNSVSRYNVLALEGMLGDDQNHLTLRYQDIRPDRESTRPGSEPPNSDFETNRVVSAGLHLSPFKNYLTIKGEAALSLTTGNSHTTIPGSAQTSGYRLAQEIFGKQAAQQGVSDMAFSINASGEIINKTVQYSFGYGRVGPSFRSKGNPYLITGTNEWEGKIGAGFLKNKLNIQLFTKQEYLQNEWYGHEPVEMTRYGATVHFQFKRFPYVVVTYYPYTRTLRENTMKFQGLTATLGYTGRSKSLTTNTTLSYNANQSNYEPYADTVIITTGNVLSLTENLQLSNGIHVKASGSWQQYDKNPAFGAQISGGIRLLQRCNIQIGIDHYWDHPVRKGFSYNSSARVRLGKHLAFQFRGERMRAVFFENDYVTQVTGSLNINW